MGSDVLLGHDGSTPVYLRDDHRTAHVAILGKSRFGKTTLLEHLVLNDMRSGTAAIVIDAHGDLSKRLIGLAPAEKGTADDTSKLVLVEPNTQRPFGLNLYECPDPTDGRQVTATVGSVVEIFFKLMGVERPGYLPVIESGLRNTARVLIANSLTMTEIPLLYHDDAFRRRILAALPARTDYWREYEASTSQRQQDKREPVLNKVARFLEDDLIAPMVSQSHTTVPFVSVMDKGGTLLLNLAGLDRETVSFLGMVFLSVFSNLIHQREKIPPSQRRRVHLYLDEYGRFATPTTKRLLEEGGKYGLGVTIAHQNLAQTPEHEALDVQTLISFQLGAQDAHEVAGGFDCTPIRTKKVTRQRTEPQYREWEEEVWDSDESHSRYEQLCRAFDEADSRHHELKFAYSEASRILDALYPRGELPELHKFDSPDGSVNGVSMLNRLLRNGGCNRSVTHELREILTRLYGKYGREARARREEFREAYQWLDRTAAHYEEVYEETDRLLPGSRKECTELKSTATSFHKLHTSREWRTEYIGETPAKDDRGRSIYDYIEEIDQTHADRQAEIANILTQLPRYLAYCKVFENDRKSHEHRIETLPPAKPDTHFFDSQRERQERISRKIRGADEIKLNDFGRWSPEVGFTFEQNDFKEAMTAFMQDIRYDVRSYGNEPSAERRVEEVRERSRERFGTLRSEVEEQIRKRQMRPPPDDGQPSRPTPKPKGPPPPVSPPPKPPAIGRRSPPKQ